MAPSHYVSLVLYNTCPQYFIVTGYRTPIKVTERSKRQNSSPTQNTGIMVSKPTRETLYFWVFLFCCDVQVAALGGPHYTSKESLRLVYHLRINSEMGRDKESQIHEGRRRRRRERGLKSERGVSINRSCSLSPLFLIAAVTWHSVMCWYILSQTALLAVKLHLIVPPLRLPSSNIHQILKPPSDTQLQPNRLK